MRLLKLSWLLEKRVTDLLDFVTLLRSASEIDFKESKENGASPGAWKVC